MRARGPRRGPLGAPLGGVDRVANRHVVGLLPGVQPLVVGAVQLGLEAAGGATDLSHPGGHGPFGSDFPRQFTAARVASIPALWRAFVYDVHSFYPLVMPSQRPAD